MRESCRICSNSTSKLFSKNGYNVVKCTKCDTIQVEHDKTLDDLIKEVYDTEEHLDLYLTPLSKWERRIWFRESATINFFKSNGGKILDIGCNTGKFLHILDGNWDKYGVEPNLQTAKLAKDRGIKVHVGEIFDAGYDSDFFDVVTLYEVINHLIDPIAVFKEINRILKSGGLLVVHSGNIEALIPKLLGPKWKEIMVPTHLFFFSHRTLNDLLNRTGFSVKKTIFKGGGHFGKYIGTLEYILSDYVKLFNRIPIEDIVVMYAIKEE